MISQNKLAAIQAWKNSKNPQRVPTIPNTQIAIQDQTTSPASGFGDLLRRNALNKAQIQQVSQLLQQKTQPLQPAVQPVQASQSFSNLSLPGISRPSVPIQPPMSLTQSSVQRGVTPSISTRPQEQTPYWEPTPNVRVRDIAREFGEATKGAVGSIVGIPMAGVGTVFGGINMAMEGTGLSPKGTAKLMNQPETPVEGFVGGIKSGKAWLDEIQKTATAFASGKDATVERIAESFRRWVQITTGEDLGIEYSRKAVIEDKVPAILGIAGMITDMYPIFRGVGSITPGAAARLPYAKNTPTGVKITIPAEEAYQIEIAHSLNKAGIKTQNIIRTADGVEVIVDETPIKFTPEQIPIPKNIPKGKVLYEQMQRSPLGRATGPITKIGETRAPTRGTFFPERQALPAQGTTPTGMVPIGQPSIVPGQNPPQTTTVIRGNLPEAIRPALPEGTGRTFVPPQDTPQAAFQMVTPGNPKALAKLRQSLNILLAQKQSLMRGTPSRQSIAEVNKLQGMIKILDSQLQETQRGTITATGPTERR